MQATGWSTRRTRTTGAGYGLRIPDSDRDQWLDRSWDQALIVPDGDPIAVVWLSVRCGFRVRSCVVPSSIEGLSPEALLLCRGTSGRPDMLSCRRLCARLQFVRADQ